jgi:hypothetical protein
MSRLPQLRLSKDALLRLAVAGLVLQTIAFSGLGHQVVQAAQSVFIANTATDPVPVAVQGTTQISDVDRPARQPFQRQGVFFIDTNALAGADRIEIPAGKRLVLEYVAMTTNPRVETDDGISLFMIARCATCWPGVADPGVPLRILLHNQGTTLNGQFTALVGSQEIRLYADPGTTLSVVAQRDHVTGSSLFVNYTLVGHFVDAG